MYDIETKKSKHRLESHTDDINAVCFTQDDSFCHTVLSGGDDKSIYLWDLRAHHEPQGCFVGHLEGITYLSPKGDDR